MRKFRLFCCKGRVPSRNTYKSCRFAPDFNKSAGIADCSYAAIDIYLFNAFIN